MGRQGDTSETVKPATAVKTASEQINWRAMPGARQEFAVIIREGG